MGAGELTAATLLEPCQPRLRPGGFKDAVIDAATARATGQNHSYYTDRIGGGKLQFDFNALPGGGGDCEALHLGVVCWIAGKAPQRFAAEMGESKYWHRAVVIEARS